MITRWKPGNGFSLRAPKTSGLPGCFIVSSSLLGGAADGVPASRSAMRALCQSHGPYLRDRGIPGFETWTGWSLGFSQPVYLEQTE